MNIFNNIKIDIIRKNKKSYAKELGAKESFMLNWEKQNIKGEIFN